MNKIKKYVIGNEFEMVPTMLNGLFGKTASYVTPQDLKRELCAGEGEVHTLMEEVKRKKKEEKVEEAQEEKQCMLMEEEEKVRKAEIKLMAYIVKNTLMKMSKNGFPELGLSVTSKVVNGIRLYPCHIEGCIKGFKSPHICDAHINRHIGYEYGRCKNCGYTNASHDSYDKHKCFAGLKMGGTKPPSRGPRAEK